MGKQPKKDEQASRLGPKALEKNSMEADSVRGGQPGAQLPKPWKYLKKK